MKPVTKINHVMCSNGVEVYKWWNS